ncbi:unnamed protein product [Sphagnum balticum]
MAKFPEGTAFGIWYPVKEKYGLRIRRRAALPDGGHKYERLDRKTYAHIAPTYEAILAHCDRLNYGANMAKKRKVEIESAFLPPHILDGFQTELLAAIPDKGFANYLFNRALKEYFLDFFVNHLRLPDPKVWSQHQTEWGQALLSKGPYKIFDSPTSVRTITLVVQTANRFMKYLHQQMPNLYSLIQFQPISRAVLKLYASNLKSEPPGQFITDPDWLELQKHLTRDIKPFIDLMYFYGLRRAESLGFASTDAVRKTYLSVEQQLVAVIPDPKYSPLKNREKRKTPHWFIDAAGGYKLVLQSLEYKMHPDTLSDKWDKVMKSLGMDYRLHDLRRTFITRALRTQNPRDVQLAVGHSDLRTTMGYAQDDRDMGDEIWKPAS